MAGVELPDTSVISKNGSTVLLELNGVRNQHPSSAHTPLHRNSCPMNETICKGWHFLWVYTDPSEKVWHTNTQGRQGTGERLDVTGPQRT